MSITTIIFDLGAVVLDNDWHEGKKEKIQEFSDHFSVTEEEMENGWRKWSHGYLKGEFSEDEYWKRFLSTAGSTRIDIEKAKELYRKHQGPIENMLALVRDLKKRYRILALTTIGKEWLDFKTEKYGLNDLFEVIISSGYSGLMKPDKRIYELLVKRADLVVEECIFIDDKKTHTDAAETVGMKGILFVNEKLLKEDLKKLELEW